MAVPTRKLFWGLVAGAVAVGAAAAAPPTPPPAKPVAAPAKAAAQPAADPADAPDPVRAVDPLGAMLSEAKTAYGGLRDYTCVFTRQERANGVLSAEQVAEMKVRVKPYSVAVRYARPEAIAGMEASYSAASASGKARFRPGVGKNLMLVSLDDPKVQADAHRPLNELGIGPALDRLGAAVAREKALRNPVEVYAADFQFAGRNVTRYEVYTRRPHTHRAAYRTVMYVDKETKLPLRFEAHDAPKPGATAGDLLEAHSYTGVKTNVGLGDSAFGE